MPNVFNVYEIRPVAPDHWPELAKQWASRLQEDGRVTYSLCNPTQLAPEFTEEQASDWWMPIERIAHTTGPGGAFELAGRPSSGSGQGVILVWMDGTVHEGVAPRSPADLVHLYRVGRMTLEAEFSAGVADALGAWDQHSAGVSPS